MRTTFSDEQIKRRVDELLKQHVSEVLGRVQTPIDRVAAPLATRQSSLALRAKVNGFTTGEQRAIDEVAVHVSEYLQNRAVFAREGLQLSEFVVSRLRDEGAFADQKVFRGDPLADFNPALRAALDKLDERIPAEAFSPVPIG